MLILLTFSEMETILGKLVISQIYVFPLEPLPLETNDLSPLGATEATPHSRQPQVSLPITQEAPFAPLQVGSLIS